MTTKTMPMREFVAQHYQDVCTLCKIGSTVVLSAMHHQSYWLLVFGSPTNMATVCEYDDWKEWQMEMIVLRRAATNGGEGGSPDMGVTVNLPPSPPYVPASNTRALSASEEAVLPS